MGLFPYMRISRKATSGEKRHLLGDAMKNGEDWTGFGCETNKAEYDTHF